MEPIRRSAKRSLKLPQLAMASMALMVPTDLTRTTLLPPRAASLLQLQLDMVLMALMELIGVRLRLRLKHEC
jgi:hypothetical protein